MIAQANPIHRNPALENALDSRTLTKSDYSDRSKRRMAILIGASLLLMALVAGLTVPALNSLFVLDNPTKTAANVIDNFGTYLGGIAGWVGIFLLDVAVSFGIYGYYKKEQPKMATLTAGLRAAYSAILGAGIVQLFLVSTSSSAPAIYRGMELFNKFWGVGLILFGVHLVALGFLFRNEGGKKWVNVVIRSLLIIAGIGYVVQYVGILIAANPVAFAELVNPIFIAPMILGEVTYALWKLLKGGREKTYASS